MMLLSRRCATVLNSVIVCGLAMLVALCAVLPRQSYLCRIVAGSDGRCAYSTCGYDLRERIRTCRMRAYVTAVLSYPVGCRR